MDGVELTPQEFAYLLAVVHAPAVIGVDDPKLFPSDARAEKAVYGKGRQQLEEHKWIEPLADHEDEYWLDPGLVQLVAVVAGPEHVIATIRSGDDGDRQTTLHYLFGNRIVELWTTPEKSYLLGQVDDRQALLERIQAVLQVPEKSDGARFSLPEEAFQKAVTFAENGKSDKAEELLASAGEHAEAFFSSFTEPGGGQLFVVQPSQGEIASGRRATVIGGKWVVVRPSAEADELDISSLDSKRLDELLSEWLE